MGVSGRQKSAGPRHVTNVVLALLVVLTTFACAKPRSLVDTRLGPGPAIRVGLPTGEIIELGLEHYIVGSVVAEADFRGLDAVAAGRVARVQAILARTYALANRDRHDDEGFDLCATTHCQVYHPDGGTDWRVGALTLQAARATAGLVIVHDGRPINAVYHANCGGHTSDAAVPWGGDTPSYLTGTADTYCALDNPVPWRFRTSLTEVESALAADAQTRVAKLRAVRVVTYDGAGRAVDVSIEGREQRVVSGAKLRAVLVEHFGSRSIDSTLFTVSTSDGVIAFEGRGFGHGVGLCQRGARARAEQGHTPDDILAHYYPGTSVRRYY